MSAIVVEGITLDRTDETEAKRHAKQGRARNAPKSVKARDEAQKQIDPERLSKAIQYFKTHPQR
jgi:hypothetical protein